jgi:hypothetical protein
VPRPKIAAAEGLVAVVARIAVGVGGPVVVVAAEVEELAAAAAVVVVVAEEFVDTMLDSGLVAATSEPGLVWGMGDFARRPRVVRVGRGVFAVAGHGCMLVVMEAAAVVKVGSRSFGCAAWVVVLRCCHHNRSSRSPHRIRLTGVLGAGMTRDIAGWILGVGVVVMRMAGVVRGSGTAVMAVGIGPGFARKIVVVQTNACRTAGRVVGVLDIPLRNVTVVVHKHPKAQRSRSSFR